MTGPFDTADRNGRGNPARRDPTRHGLARHGLTRRDPARRDPTLRDPTLRDLAPEGQLRRLELTVTRRLDGLLHGQYLGLLPGSGSEIAGSREYRPGEDEVRRMDWAVTARTMTPHVREVDADRELSTWLLVDATPSMDFGTAELEKRELAVAAVAAIGFLTAGAGNRLGANVIGVHGVRRYPARTGRAHLLGLLRTLLAAPRGAASGRTPGLADAIRALDRATQRRGLVVIVSDFLDGLPDDGLPDDNLPDDRLRGGGLAGGGLPGDRLPGGGFRAGDGGSAPDWEAAVRRLAARHQVLAVEITDPRELELPDVGLITLVDPETGARREVSTGDPRTRERYAAAAAGQRELVRQALRRSGAAHLPLRTDRDWTADIVRHVHTQRRLTAAGRGRPATASGGAR